MAASVDTLILILVGVTAAWAVLCVVVVRRSRNRRREVAVLQARPRRRRLREESGVFVPLSPVRADQEAEPEPRPEPEPDPEPEPEPEPGEFPLPPGRLRTATTYAIVWYRDEDRVAFGLQPVDGRAEPWARYRSSAFVWPEDRDPPADLRGAQRAHGRLLARLERDGWELEGRGDAWFSHRFRPPSEEPERGDDGDEA